MARLLVVDDQPEILLLMERMLTMSGHTVITAVNGRDALERALELQPDLILTDLMMPIMSGGELIEHLRADDRTKAIPIVVISAYPDKVEGADAYMRKPFMHDDLISQVDALLPAAS